MTDHSAKTPLWTSREIQGAVGGRLATCGPEAWTVTGISIDTRTLAPGDLFIAIKGERVDGHAYIGEAMAAGAAGAIVEKGALTSPPDYPAVVVEDTMGALVKLAEHARARTAARVVAVTGSVGKTGSKEALRRALGVTSPVHATEGNLNNHIGLPLTLARMPADCAFAVFELGMNHAGEIRPLSRLARPDVALITAVEDVHSAHFDGIEGIADAKAEIFQGLEPGGTAVLNRDNRMYDRLVSRAQMAGVTDLLSFGSDVGCDVRLLKADLGPDGSDVSAEVMGQAVSYRLGVPGNHWVMNSLGVLGVVSALGRDVQAAADALMGLRPPKGRGDRFVIAIDGGTLTLADESYNASPASVRAAVEVLGMTTPGDKGRRIAILGDMLELGERSNALHVELAGPLQAEGIDLVFTAGQYMGELFEALPKAMRGGHALTAERLVPLVASRLRAGDMVLVKGSNGSRMSAVVQAIRALGGSNGSGRPTSAPNSVR